MSDPVEQAAAALYENLFEPAAELKPFIEDEPPWAEIPEHRKDYFRNQVVVVIAALGLTEQVGERHDPKLPWDHPGFPERRFVTPWEPIQ